MEKRQLVRTFGSALAAATLSFGLFAAPAIAADTVKVSGAQVELIGEAKGSGVAEEGDFVAITIPASVVGLKEINGGTMVLKASNGTIDQELSLAFAYNGEQKEMDPESEEFKANYFCVSYKEDDNHQKVIDKIVAKVAVDKEMLNGTWELKELTLKNGADKIADVDADVSFQVAGNDDHKANFAVDLETIMTKKSVYHGKDNWLYVKLKKQEGADRVKPDAAQATYLNPAGEEQKYDLTLDEGNKYYESGKLNTQVDGYYALKSIKLSAVIKEATETDPGTLTDNVVFDDFALLTDGDYEVSLTGVEAMQRLYNPWTGEHIYTNDPLEAVAAIVAGWVDEGLAWYAPVNQLYPEAVAPVYRVYNQYNGEHHYTTSVTEATALVLAGWTDEGVGFYTTTKNDAKAEAVYRLFNQYATVGTHHYTTDKGEYDELVKVGWTGENVGWYGVKLNKTTQQQ